jgi:hypothetical protein
LTPHFNLWNHFFRAQFPQGSDAEAAVLGGVNIYVKNGHGVDPYFDLPMLESSDRWQKRWFFLRSAAATPLPVFTGNCSIPLPNQGYLGPCYPDRPFSKELGDVEVNTQIHKVLIHGADLNPGADLGP